MKTKLILTVIAIMATIGIATPAMLDSAFANKGGVPNDNAVLNPFKSCEKHQDQKKCVNIPDDNEDEDSEEDNPDDDGEDDGDNSLP
jgi:hypothetical protein